MLDMARRLLVNELSIASNHDEENIHSELENIFTPEEAELAAMAALQAANS